MLKIAETFSTYFDNKIQLIRAKLDQTTSQMTMSTRSTDPTTSHHTHQSRLSVFAEEIRKIIMKSPTESCSLDQLPTQLLKDNLLHLITPLIKNILKNYIPVSNLPFFKGP